MARVFCVQLLLVPNQGRGLLSGQSSVQVDRHFTAVQQTSWEEEGSVWSCNTRSMCQAMLDIQSCRSTVKGYPLVRKSICVLSKPPSEMSLQLIGKANSRRREISPYHLSKSCGPPAPPNHPFVLPPPPRACLALAGAFLATLLADFWTFFCACLAPPKGFGRDAVFLGVAFLTAFFVL